MLAAQDLSLSSAATTVYQLSEDERIRQQAEAREDYLLREQDLADRIAERDQIIAEMGDALAEKDNALAEMSGTLANKDSEIARLKALLAEKSNTP